MRAVIFLLSANQRKFQIYQQKLVISFDVLLLLPTYNLRLMTISGTNFDDVF